MAYTRDTDRVAGDLLKAVLGSMNKPVGGATQAQPQVDERSMLSTIKDVLGHSLPGMKEQEKPAAPTAPHGGTADMQTPAVGGWEGLFRRQAQEREAMHTHHEREREEMQRRHLQDMEAAMAGQGGSSRVVRRQTRPRQVAALKSTARRTRTRRTGS